MIARNSLCRCSHWLWWWATTLSPQHPLEQPPQHMRGLDTAPAPQVGHRRARLGLQGHGSKRPAPANPALKWNGLDDLQSFFQSPKNGCPCSTSTVPYLKGFCEVGLKITSITQQNSKFNWGVHKKLETLHNSSLISSCTTSKFQLNLKPFTSNIHRKF